MDSTAPHGTIIITGASSGIGHALAHRLAPSARLVLTARRGDQLQALCDTLPGDHAIVAGDIADPAVSMKCVDAAGDALRGVIANAGTMPIAPVQTAALEHWHDTVRVNLEGTLNIVHGALAAMPDGGDVVLMSSVAGRGAFSAASVYGATKAAINSFAEALRAETAAAMKHGGPAIRVTTVLPGAVDTELPASIRDDATRAGTEAYYEGMTHVLSADDVADAVAWAMQRPAHVSINELVIRPTGMVR